MQAIGLLLLLFVITAQAMGMTGYGTPSLLSPYPLLLTIPAFMGIPIALLVLLFCVLAAVFSSQLRHGDGRIPRRAIVLYGLFVPISAVMFIVGWSYGVQYQGARYALGAAMSSAALVAILAALLWLNRRQASLWSSTWFHFLLFAWLGTFAVPYMGETP